MIIFNFGAKFVAVCRTVYISMEYLEPQIRPGKRKLYSSYDQRYAKANFSRSNERVFGKSYYIRLFCSLHEIHKLIKEVIWKLMVLSIIKMHIHNLCGKVAHSLMSL